MSIAAKCECGHSMTGYCLSRVSHCFKIIRDPESIVCGPPLFPEKVNTSEALIDTILNQQKIKTMTVRAKFKCNSVTDFGNQKQISFNAVYGTSGENASFTKYTPYGELKINIDSDAPAADFFKPQKEYYLNFEEA